jgi:hypothetical protein
MGVSLSRFALFAFRRIQSDAGSQVKRGHAPHAGRSASTQLIHRTTGSIFAAR